MQLIRVYAQSIRKIAEAEVRLFHLYVHEPLIRQGVDSLQMAEEMEGLVRDLLPLTSPFMEYVHQRYLRFYIEQDVVGHMEAELGGHRQLGRVQMAFCFVDLTGFTRYTEEEGDEEAFDLVERFIETVEATLPAEALIVKTIGDEVMIVSPDPVTLTEWAVGFMELFQERPQPRVGLHYGRAVYRDGDYFGSEVNLTHRVVARALGGEVMVTAAVADAIGGSDYLEFDPIGEVDLRGLSEAGRAVRRSRPRPAGRGLRRDRTVVRPDRRNPRARAVRSPRGVAMTSKQRALDALADATRSSGLIDSLSSGVVMVSGGADSACLAAGLAQAIDPKGVHALHVNYGLRDSAERDELVCRDLCSRLRIDLHIERPEPLAATATFRRRRGRCDTRPPSVCGCGPGEPGSPPATRGPTSPRRCSIALRPRPGRARSAACRPSSGRVVRPLLGLERAETRRLAAEAELPFADDESNLDLRFARNRIRAEALPALRELGPVERNIAETQAELIEEAELLDRVVLQALEAAGAGAGAVTIRADALAGWEPALRRLALRALAERACGHGIALGRRRSAEIVRLASRPEGGRGRPRRRAYARSASTG